MTAIRTRFAPSPTGYMHIGGMRTALFNWLWARHNGGRFVLRIDDTDRQRNLEDTLDPILHAFRWLGLEWDEGPEVGGEYGPYFQSERSGIYAREIERLVSERKAYRDFSTPEQVQADRTAAEQEKRTYLNDRWSFDLPESEVRQRTADGEPHVVRLLVDRERTVAVDDHVRGHVEWDCGLITDPVIVRGDGSPLYNFASVVDDAAMQISHVIRAEEHLTNTAVQVLLFDALGHDLPEFAHIPFVAAPGTKEKLSKREKKIEKYRKSPQFKKLFDLGDTVFPLIGVEDSDALNPVMVSFYEQIGFLPEAVLNGLARLGWSYDDKTENMSLPFVVENFTLDRVVKAPAGLDPDKLLSYQEHWMGQLSLEEKVAGCLPYLTKAGRVNEPVSDEQRSFVSRLVGALGDRLKLFSDVLSYDEYFVADTELTRDEKAFEKRVRKPEDAVPLLREFREELATADRFEAESLERVMKAFVEQREIGLGRIIHAVRVAVTGKPGGPGMFECLELLGREACLNRIDGAIDLAVRSGGTD